LKLCEIYDNRTDEDSESEDSEEECPFSKIRDELDPTQRWLVDLTERAYRKQISDSKNPHFTKSIKEYIVTLYAKCGYNKHATQRVAILAGISKSTVYRTIDKTLDHVPVAGLSSSIVEEITTRLLKIKKKTGTEQHQKMKILLKLDGCAVRPSLFPIKNINGRNQIMGYFDPRGEITSLIDYMQNSGGQLPENEKENPTIPRYIKSKSHVFLVYVVGNNSHHCLMIGADIQDTNVTENDYAEQINWISEAAQKANVQIIAACLDCERSQQKQFRISEIPVMSDPIHIWSVCTYMVRKGGY